MKKLFLIPALMLGVAGAAMAADTAPSEPPHHRGDMFLKMDTNHDGVVTKAEADAFHEKKFNDIDANKDGKITKEEMETYRAARKADHEKRKAERKASVGGTVKE